MKTLKQFLNTNNDKNKVFLGGTLPESRYRSPKANLTIFLNSITDWIISAIGSR